MAGIFKKWISKLMETPEEKAPETEQSLGEENTGEAAQDIVAVDEPKEEIVEETVVEAEESVAEATELLLEAEAETEIEIIAEAEVVVETEVETDAVLEPGVADEELALAVEEEQEFSHEILDAPETPEQQTSSLGFFERLKAGLSKTSKAITDRIDLLLNDYGKIDEELYEELEEILITADIGMETTMSLIDDLKKALVERRISDASQVKSVLRDVMVDTLKAHSNNHLNLDQSPAILFVIGVNGAGKTTTIGKIAHKLKLEGKTVMLAAADTFRAAAIDQLKIWGERSGVPVIAHQEGSDPAAVVYDAIQAAKARKTDVLICDTAGRLHNKKNLMNELAKIFRVIERDFPEAQREVLLVLDATTGQNGLQQAKIFKETAQITGIALTKLDGTAKGGVVLSILHEVEIPVKLIGVGEGLNDLQPFEPEKFVNALLDI
ncbi:signal recognition particle-docking protein FtsY [Acidaminobacter sp.]|uniref:signal recognition particle-docking protein FtsY n=1 Tax=Acidaminobacter sp. TaxID=1872102 RepID=UPI002563D5D2|nr:signal recognition particle-docking protein FtsY [Acidaminobacter sp.]MDK9709599.1 signal recognition particle-docking protein FtsY [Acidaminobacter sp.]